MQIKKVGIITHPRVQPTFIADVAKEFSSRGLELFFDPVAAEKAGKKETPVSEMEIDLALVAGGDGTILWVAGELTCDPLILGVNIGQVGHLAELFPDELESGLKKLFSGDYKVDARDRLRVNGGLALNEALVVGRDPASLLDFSVFLDDAEVSRFRADGVMVATPTGSTGYSLSAGGPLMHPGLGGFTITPVNPFLKQQPSLVVPDSSKVKIVPLREDKPAQLILDGRPAGEVACKEAVEVGKADAPLRFVRFSSSYEYDHINTTKPRWTKERDF